MKVQAQNIYYNYEVALYKESLSSNKIRELKDSSLPY